jgi:mono/diheme cytochrome c family protein
MHWSSGHLWLAIGVLGACDVADTAYPADFKRDIQPIFESRCYECHGDKKQKSGLRLDRQKSVFQGGDSGKPAIAAGKSGESPLIQRVTTADKDEMMPPKGERLTEAQIKLLKEWIDQGASWPQESVGEEKVHWAYVKPQRPPLPQVKRTDWPRNGIDYFVLSRLEKENLQPAPEADKAVLLRRASLDLIGLPPTLDELEKFLSDRRPEAYEEAIDRVLASPHYGERWARPWLDLARYADTQGYEKDNRRSMWPYRDWVIQALNEDMAFDEFTLEQIAGDMLPNATQDQKVATGFHRNTMTNTEGGTDNEEFRHEAIIDRINTTMGVWMGSTFGCAQCHNHKYDPFTTKEYYSFYAFLNNTADADDDDEKPTLKVYQVGQKEKHEQLRAQLKAAETSFKEAADKPQIDSARSAWEQSTARAFTNWQVLDPFIYSSKGGAALTKTESKSLAAEGKNPSNDVYVVVAQIDAQRITGFRLEVLESGENKALGRHPNGAFVLTKLEVEAAPKSGGQSRPVRLANATADYNQDGFNVTNLLAGTGQGWAVGAADKKLRLRRSAYFSLDKPVESSEGATLTFTLRHDSKSAEANIARFRLYATTADSFEPPPQLPDEVRAALFAEKRDDKQKGKLKEQFDLLTPLLASVREAYLKAKDAEKKFYDSVPISSVMQELEKPRETHVLTRGNFLSKGDKVRPSTPAVLHPFSPSYPSDRVGLAKWLVDTNNPLTARVIMNRFWEQFFGKGLVETVEDFGIQGESPSHPELFDWLATEFMQTGWSMKRMHKLIVMSATYRQSSRVTPELVQRDPYNRLLARGPRVRLEAEMIRDQALAVSGLLARKLGGPSVMPPQPDGLWQVVYSGDKWETSKGHDKYRRALYTFWRRSIPHPAMTTFDAPSREFCVLRRSRSNTPLQALTTLNDPAFIEAAQALARRIANHDCKDAKARAEYAFRLCLLRAPTAVEVERLVKLFETEAAHYRSDSKAAEKMATSEIGKPSQSCDLADLAAWTVVSNVLLNLDEMITKG